MNRSFPSSLFHNPIERRANPNSVSAVSAVSNMLSEIQHAPPLNRSERREIARSLLNESQAVNRNNDATVNHDFSYIPQRVSQMGSFISRTGEFTPDDSRADPRYSFGRMPNSNFNTRQAPYPGDEDPSEPDESQILNNISRNPLSRIEPYAPDRTVAIPSMIRTGNPSFVDITRNSIAPLINTDPYVLKDMPFPKIATNLRSYYDKSLLARLYPGRFPAPLIVADVPLTAGQGIIQGNKTISASSFEFTLIGYSPVSSSVFNGSGLTVGQSNVAANVFLSEAVLSAAGWTSLYSSAPPPSLSGIVVWASELGITFEGAAATMGGSVYMGWVPNAAFYANNTITWSTFSSYLERIPITAGTRYAMRTSIQDTTIISQNSYGSTAPIFATTAIEHVLVFAIHQPAYSITAGTGANSSIIIDVKSNYVAQLSGTDQWMRGLLPAQEIDPFCSEKILSFAYPSILSSHTVVNVKSKLKDILTCNIQNCSNLATYSPSLLGVKIVTTDKCKEKWEALNVVLDRSIQKNPELIGFLDDWIESKVPLSESNS
jgi:hypothetical protein